MQHNLEYPQKKEQGLIGADSASRMISMGTAGR
jgi:hypothetical protein